MRRVRCIGLEAGGRANRDADVHGHPGASATRGDGGHRTFPSHLHSRPSNRAAACHSHSVRAPEPNADLHGYADVDLDAISNSNHNAYVGTNRDLYVNFDAYRDSHGAFAYGHVSFAYGNGPIGNPNSADLNFHPCANVACAAYADLDSH